MHFAAAVAVHTLGPPQNRTEQNRTVSDRQTLTLALIIYIVADLTKVMTVIELQTHTYSLTHSLIQLC